MAKSLHAGDIKVAHPGMSMVPMADNNDGGLDKYDDWDGAPYDGDPTDGWDLGRGP